jgi:hypothetical protein
MLPKSVELDLQHANRVPKRIQKKPESDSTRAVAHTGDRWQREQKS